MDKKKRDRGQVSGGLEVWELSDGPFAVFMVANMGWIEGS